MLTKLTTNMVENLDNQLQTIASSASSNASSIVEVKEDLGTLNTSVESINTEVEEIETSLIGQATRLSTAENEISRTDEKIGNYLAANPLQGYPETGKTRLGTIVVFGSSTAQGYGTTEHISPSAGNNWTAGPNAWVTLLKNRLGTDATVINRGVGGKNTVTNIERFWTDVAPHKPSIVILCTGWVNEPGTDVAQRVGSYITNTLELARMCRSIGAVPIVVCTQAITDVNVTAQFDIGRALDYHGIQRWDFMCNVMDDQYRLLPECAMDGIHGNDLAHKAYLESIDIGSLYCAGDYGVNLAPNQVRSGRAIYISAANAEARPPLCLDNSFDPASSWSIMVEARGGSAKSNSSGPLILPVFIDSNGTSSTPFRINTNANGYWSVAPYAAGADPVIVSSVSWDSPLPHTHLLCFNHITNTLTYFIDSVKIGSYVYTALAGLKVRQMRIGGSYTTDAGWRLTNWWINDFAWWKTDFGQSVSIVQRVDTNDELNAASLIAAPSMGNSGNQSFVNAMKNKCRIMAYGCYLAKDHSKNLSIRAKLTSNISIPNGSTPTTLIFNNAFNDPGGFVDTTTGFINLPTGRYHVHVSLRFNASASENWAALSIRGKTDNILGEAGNRFLHQTGTRENLSISQVIVITDMNDGIFIKCWHTDTVAREIDGLSWYQYLNVVRIGD